MIMTLGQNPAMFWQLITQCKCSVKYQPLRKTPFFDYKSFISFSTSLLVGVAMQLIQLIQYHF